MTKTPKLKAGIGAKCSALIKFLHPSKLVTDTLLNTQSNARLSDLVAIRKESRRVSRRDQTCVVFRHDSFPNKELYCVEKFCKVLEGGDPVDYFGTAETLIEQVEFQEDDHGEELPPNFQNLQGTAEDMAMMEGLGFHVDNDNEPAPENVPDQGVQEEECSGTDNGLCAGQSWGWDGICDRRSHGFDNAMPKLSLLQ